MSGTGAPGRRTPLCAVPTGDEVYTIGLFKREESADERSREVPAAVRGTPPGLLLPRPPVPGQGVREAPARPPGGARGTAGLDGAESSEDAESTDWRAVGLGELCEHILAVHHGGPREAFPRIGGLLDTVVRVHGTNDSRLHDVQRRFNEIRADLEPHIAIEEDEPFPACIAWERHATPVDEQVIAKHEQEHATLGVALAVLRRLCDDYAPAVARCNTHRALLGALEGFEQDLHRHVHEENDILLLRVRAPSEPLLPCCKRWIAEQTHH